MCSYPILVDTYAGILLMADQSPGYVQRQLGHSSISIVIGFRERAERDWRRLWVAKILNEIVYGKCVYLYIIKKGLSKLLKPFSIFKNGAEGGI